MADGDGDGWKWRGERHAEGEEGGRWNGEGGEKGREEMPVLGNKLVTNLLGEWWDGTGWWCFGTVWEGL